MTRSFLVLLVLVALLVQPARAKILSQLGIAIQSCVINSNGYGQSNGVNVVYYNTHPSPATEVDFLIGYHGHRAILTDRGWFTQNAQINHNLTNALVGFTWNGPKPNRCTVQRVVLNNGKVLTQ